MDWSYLIVFLGAGLGGMLRHALNSVLPFPWATPVINVTGSAAMGFVAGWLALKAGGSQPWRLFIATGILGGYTTFSTFSLETVTLLERHAYASALFYVLGSVVFGLAGLFGALALTRGL